MYLLLIGNLESQCFRRPSCFFLSIKKKKKNTSGALEFTLRLHWFSLLILLSAFSKFTVALLCQPDDIRNETVKN